MTSPTRSANSASVPCALVSRRFPTSVQGLDAVANEVERQIAKIDFTELRLSGGQAVLEDVKADNAGGQIDQWAEGTWETALAIDNLRIPVIAEFTATRM